MRLLAVAMVVPGATTVWCTAMIYASLKPVPQWRHPTVPAYLLLAIATGTLLLAAGCQRRRNLRARAALVSLASAWMVKELYWRVHRPQSGLTAADATGLRGLGSVRPLDAPHTESNYLLHEMGYRLAGGTRQFACAAADCGFALPTASLMLLAIGLAVGPAGRSSPAAALAALVGTLIERWLFFAEARHTVTLYYGAGRLTARRACSEPKTMSLPSATGEAQNGHRVAGDHEMTVLPQTDHIHIEVDPTDSP